MATYNLAMVEGNITNDFEDIKSDGIKLSKATNRYFTKDDEKKQVTEYHRIHVFNKLKDFVLKNFKKGNQIRIEGERQVFIIEKDDKKKKYYTILASKVDFPANLNSVTLLGRLGADPKLNQLEQNQVTTFSLAVNKADKTQETMWFNISTWGKLAAVSFKYLKKGSQVLVKGSIRTSKWETDGEENTKDEIVAQHVIFVSDIVSGVTQSD